MIYRVVLICIWLKDTSFLCTPETGSKYRDMQNDSWTYCGQVTPYGIKTGSPLVQVMACSLMAPSHYLNQCWLIINELLWTCGIHLVTVSQECSRYISLLVSKWLISFYRHVSNQFQNRACHRAAIVWGYYPGTLSNSQVSATYLKIRHPHMESRGTQSSYELQWLRLNDLKIGH